MKIIQKLETLVKGVAFSGLTLAASFGMADRVKAETVPHDFFATTDAKKIQLANYDSVATTSNWDDYYSTKIKWNDGTKTDVPTGYRVWMLDDDKKPCGLYDISTAGRYGFLHAYEDDALTTTIDEGANSGDVMSVLVEKKDTGDMYNAWFVDSSSSYNPITVNFQADKGRYSKDILVNSTSIPEPSTLALIATGALAGAGLALKRRK